MYVYKSVAESKVANAAFRAISLATQSPAVTGGREGPCFAAWAVCAGGVEDRVDNVLETLV